MQINKVTIKNFRNYIGEHVFDLTKKITILHGNNGFGKSSFFDAIEWCLTDKISRFDDSDGLKKDVLNRYVSKDESTECLVSVEFGGYILTRKFNITNGISGNIQVKITDKDGVTITTGQENVDKFLKSEFYSDTNFGKGIYGRLLKQTYILSQDQVTEFIISDSPEERFRSLADIMGFKPMLNLSDNMKKVLSKLDSHSKDLKHELEKLDESIKSKEETKIELNVFDVNETITKLGIRLSKQQNLEGQLDSLNTKLYSEKVQEGNFLKLLGYLIGKYTNVLEIRDKQIETKRINEKYQITIEQFKNLSSKVKNRLDSLEILKSNVETLTSIKKEIKEKEKLLDEMGVIKNVQEISSILQEERNISAKYEYNISIFNEYHEIIKDQKQIPERVKTLSIEIRKLVSRLEKREKIIRILSNLLVNSHDSVLVNLLNNIQGIHQYVENSDIDGHCPVCSSDLGPALVDSIQKNVNHYSEKLTEQAKFADRILKLKTKVENSVDDYKNKIKQNNFEIKRLETKLKRINDQLNSFMSNEYYDEEMIQLDYKEIVVAFQKNKNKLLNLDNALKEVISLNNLREKLQSFNLIEGDLQITSTEEMSKSILRLNRAKKRINALITKKGKYCDELLLEEELLMEDLKKVISFVDDTHLEMNFQELIVFVRNRISEIEAKIGLVDKAKNISKNMQINTNVEKQILKVKDDKQKIESKLERLNTAMESLRAYISNLSDGFGDRAKDYLNKLNSPIQKYYRYLNPLPSSSLIQFEGENDELWIRAAFDSDTTEDHLTKIRNILSSGQLNVLAISIFLAINDSQKIHPLDFVAIDDPIQNMDDVNQFSVCDILGAINKQLIFSTHDLEFVKLFIKKNEYKKKDIQIYSFKSPYLNTDKVDYVSFT